MKTIGTRHKNWETYSDFFYRRKSVGRFIVELVAGKDRGGVIVVWTQDQTTLSEFVSSKAERAEVGDKEFVEFIYAPFMHSENAQARYRTIRTVKSLNRLYVDVA